MALVKRLVKGTPLTFEEGDGNLDYLYGLSTNTGSFITQEQTGSFLKSYQTGSLGPTVVTGSLLVSGSISQTGSLSVSGSITAYPEAGYSGFFAYDSSIIARDYTNNNNAYISAESGNSLTYARIGYNNPFGPYLAISNGVGTGLIMTGSNWGSTYYNYYLPAKSGEFVIFPYSGSAVITGSLAVTGSFTQNGFVILTKVSESLNFADDTEAAANGVPVGGLYRNGNFVLIRIT